MTEILIISSKGELVCKPYSINDLNESKPITDEIDKKLEVPSDEFKDCVFCDNDIA